MLSQFKIITITHKTVNLEEIKHFLVDDSDVGNKLNALKDHFKFQELFYLNTCNRVMYFFISPQAADESFVQSFFDFLRPNMPQHLKENLSSKLLYFQGADAIYHLNAVASSIDSLVVGEREILRQLREAFDNCKNWNLLGDFLRLAIDKAVLTAKTVYSNTGIGEKQISVVSLAIQKLLAAQLPKESRILMIGAGQTNALVSKFLIKHHYNNISIFNRTIEKAQELAENHDGKAFRLDQLREYKEGFDCLIVCTGASDPIITKSVYQQLLMGESGQKVILDLGIPHNVEKSVTEQFPVKYIEIEGLKSMATENLAYRENEVLKAKGIISEAVLQFQNHFKQRQLEIALRNIPTEVKAVKEKAFNEVFQSEIQYLDEKSLDLLHRMMSYMEKKCIGIPMKAAKEVVLG